MTTQPTETTHYEAVASSKLQDDGLDFPIRKLNAPLSVTSRLRLELGLLTVSQFISAFKPGTPPRIGFGPKLLQPLWREIHSLASIGSARYLKEVSFEHRTFLQLIHIVRKQLPPREGLIFDHRLFPRNGQPSTLQKLGTQLRLTRERIRQVEKLLIQEFHTGTLRDFGFIIQRNSLACFKPIDIPLPFHALLANPFFSDVQINQSSTPTPILFLSKVFPSTFVVDERTISVSHGIRRRYNSI